MDKQTKEILLKVLDEIVDLRANQDLIAAHVGTGVTIYDAADAKREALRHAKKAYGEIRKQIEDSI